MDIRHKKYNVKAELCKSLSKIDLQELCEATEEAILAGGGFGWISPPSLKHSKIIGRVFCSYLKEF